MHWYDNITFVSSLVNSHMKKFISFVVVLLCTISPKSYAQSIQLIDVQQQTPIGNASYQYGQQQGISDANGNFTIINNHQSSLKNSHLQYGVLVFDGQQLEFYIPIRTTCSIEAAI